MNGLLDIRLAESTARALHDLGWPSKYKIDDNWPNQSENISDSIAIIDDTLYLLGPKTWVFACSMQELPHVVMEALNEQYTHGKLADEIVLEILKK